MSCKYLFLRGKKTWNTFCNANIPSLQALFGCCILPVNMKLYAGGSSRIMELLRGFAEKFQQVSVDEAYLVPGPDVRNFEEAAFIFYS